MEKKNIPPTTQELTEELIAQHEKMKARRATLDTQWQEVTDYVMPNKNGITRTVTPGAKRNLQVFDSTAIQACELLAGALHGMMTNPSSIWFEYTSGDPEIDEDDEVRAWLHDATLKTHAVLNASNFQTEVHEYYLDLGSLGTGAFFTEEDDEYDVRFLASPMGETYIAENNRGVVDKVNRQFKWTLRNIVQEFGMDSLPEKLRTSYKEHMNEEFDLLQCIFPREDVDPKQVTGPRGWPVASHHILLAEKKNLREGGYREFPAAVSRWTKASGDLYGYSPGMKALPDIKMLNEMTITVLKGAQKTVDPPLMVSDEGFLLPLRTNPGGLNYRRSGNPDDKIEAFGNDARIDFGHQVMEDVRRRIREAFYVDQLQLQQGPQMTATEVMQRTEEKLKLMGPMLGRQHSEFLRPMIDRVFAIMLRKNRFLPIPDVMKVKLRGKLHVKYSSTIAKAQRASEGNNMLRFLQSISSLVQAEPTGLDNIDIDGFIREAHAIYGASPKMLRDKSDIEKRRQARADVQNQQMQAQQQAQVADSLGKVLPGAAKAKEAGVIE